MSHAFIELDRRFEEYRTDETPESQAQRSYTDALLGREGGMAWDELLQHRLVIVLGEPGSGKTQELEAQHERLRTDSFFLPLDRLVSEDVVSILDEEEIRRFEKWKKGSGEVTFFLDAVDESKIRRDDDFFIALGRVKKAVGSAIWRSRFVISSRISEWRPQTDQDGAIQLLGVDQDISKRPTPEKQRPPTERISQTSQETTEQTDKGEALTAIKVVTLLRLTSFQVERFAGASGVRNPKEFIAALEANNAWAFAGRPLDVSLLYAYWNEKGHLSNLTDLTEFMVSRQLAEVPGKKKLDVLSSAQAREGAEYLAAAVILCRRQKFRVSDASGIAGESLLSPDDVLPETWLPKECRAMMDRALFDAASHGAMSFHHRYHTEYLAAAWLTRLMSNNCGAEALEGMLFAKVDGQRVLRPALKPVAAWLITDGVEPWRLRLAEWVLESSPEIHLLHGDPAALPLDYRRRILSSLIQRYQGRSRVMLDWDRAALARLANTELADDLNRYLLDGTIAEDLRADLLMVVREGRLFACVPAALSLFADPTTSDDLKSYAVTVVRDIGDINHRQQLAQSWEAVPEFSNALLARLCEALFPQAIGVDGLLALLRRSGEVRRYNIDLPYYLNALLKQELGATKAEELLTGLLELLKTPPLMDELPLSKHFFWATSLIPVCLQNLLSKSNLSSKAYGLAIAAIFLLEQVNRHDSSHLEASGIKDMESVQQLVSPHEKLRQRLFWKRVEKYRKKNGSEPRAYELDGYGTLVELVKDDLGWLLADAGSSLPIVDRQLALEVAADKLWSARQSLLTSTWKLFRQTGGKPELVAVCRQYAWNRMRAPFMGVWYRHIRHKLLEKWWWKRRLHHIQKFRQKIYDRWWLWRHLGDLRKGHYPVTLAYFARLVAGDTGSQYGSSDWSKVSEEWGSSITTAAKQGCVVGWRQFSPLLPHEKPERNSVDHRVAIGLVGLQTLWSEGHLDFSALTADEVSLLVRYACNELNGLPEWFPFLLNIRPTEAAKSLGEAMAGEWSYPAEMEHVHDVVAKLAWMSSSIEMVAQVAMDRLQISDPLNPQMLEYALTVLTRSGKNIPDGLLVLAKTRVHNYTPDQAQWFNWMNIWLQMDAIPALNYLEDVLIEPGMESDALVVRLCSVMSGRFGEPQRVSNPSFLKPAALARFIPLVHRHVRTVEDIERANQGVYSLGARDHTQKFRLF